MLDVAEKQLPKLKTQKKQWISGETKKFANKRKQAKAVGQVDDWHQLNTDIKASIRNDLETLVADECNKIEQANGDSKVIFSTTKRITNKFSARPVAIADQEDKTKTETESILC